MIAAEGHTDMAGESDDREAQFLELAPFRARLYAWLTAAFSRAPEPQDLALIATDAFIDAIEAFGEGTTGTLRVCAASHRASGQWLVEARQEFMNLFKVPGRQYVPAYESVFRDSREVNGRTVQGLLAGPSCSDVQRWYQLAAVDVSPEFKDLNDHIALELNFLSHLCGKEIEFATLKDTRRLARTWEIERDFLSMHIVSWIGMLRDRICEKTDHPYYRGVSCLAAEFTQRDLDTLVSLAGPAHDAPWKEHGTAEVDP